MPTKPVKIFSSAIVGLDSQPIEVEVDLSYGLHSFNIVGLPDKAINEAKERISSAIKNCQAKSPKKSNYKVTVNLAPAELKKEGAGFDLAIALGFLLASEQIKFDPKDKLFVGELALDGTLRPINGALAAALMAKDRGFKTIFVPALNAKEAAIVRDLQVIGLDNLIQTIQYLEGKIAIKPETINLEELMGQEPKISLDMSWIKGQQNAKRALEIAASGGHNVRMIGPPGGGKTLLAKALATILPPLTLDEALEVTKIYSITGKVSLENPLIWERPFRNPHHTASEAALIGGRANPKPGEISLAHRGVLFLDEFPEFHRDVVESLRQPIEEGKITVSRTQGAVTFPAKFILVAAQNPCPCGYYEDPQKECTCSIQQINKYRKKISGPIGDRIDIHLEIPAVEYEELTSENPEAKTSEQIREKVTQARQVQLERFKNEGDPSTGFLRHGSGQAGQIFTNSEMNIPQIKKYCRLDSESSANLRLAVKTHRLSARSYHRILKLARTIADLEGNPEITPKNIGEAVSYRTKYEI